MKKGFTLIELAVVVAILAIIYVVGNISAKKTLQNSAKQEMTDKISAELSNLVIEAFNLNINEDILINKQDKTVDDFQGSELITMKFFEVEKDSDRDITSATEITDSEITIGFDNNGNLNYTDSGGLNNLSYDINLVFIISTEDKGSSRVDIQNTEAGAKILNFKSSRNNITTTVLADEGEWVKE